MRHVPAPTMVFNVTNCTNIEVVKEILGIGYAAGQPGKGYTPDTPDFEIMDLLLIACPGTSIHSTDFQMLCWKIGLYDKDSEGPVIIENDGTVWMVDSKLPEPWVTELGFLAYGTAGPVCISTGGKTYSIMDLEDVND